MPVTNIVKFCEIERTPRVAQVEGIFEVSPLKKSQETWQVNFPIENIEASPQTKRQS